MKQQAKDPASLSPVPQKTTRGVWPKTLADGRTHFEESKKRQTSAPCDPARNGSPRGKGAKKNRKDNGGGGETNLETTEGRAKTVMRPVLPKVKEPTKKTGIP